VTAVPRNRLALIVDSAPFTVTIVGVIIVNAIVLGLDTYEGIDERWGDELALVNAICLGVFVCELILRVASYGRRPWNFLRDGWNVFDLVVIGGAFLPGVRENATLLRLARLGRIVRVVRLLPELRVLLLGVWRSVPPLLSIGVVTGMILFVYGMVGWILFAEELPDEWGNIGRAMLTLFVMLTLENFPVYMDHGMDVHPWSWVYFVSFVLVAAFVVLNLLIGIVLNSMEEAREAERRQAVRDRHGVRGQPSTLVDVEAHAPVVERIALLRAALDELETELSTGGAEVDVAERSSAQRPRPGEA
jgi:voltage-gated sodium channel